MKQPLKHGFEFILIGSILFVAVIGLSFIKDSSLRIGLIGAISLFYVIAGIWHHYEEKICIASKCWSILQWELSFLLY